MDVSTNKTYRWSGTTLAVIGSDLALGHSSGTAFPGDEGADLQERIDAAEGALAGLKIPKLVTMTEADYAQLEEKDENTYYMLTEE